MLWHKLPSFLGIVSLLLNVLKELKTYGKVVKELMSRSNVRKGPCNYIYKLRHKIAFNIKSRCDISIYH